MIYAANPLTASVPILGEIAKRSTVGYSTAGDVRVFVEVGGGASRTAPTALGSVSGGYYAACR